MKSYLYTLDQKFHHLTKKISLWLQATNYDSTVFLFVGGEAG